MGSTIRTLLVVVVATAVALGGCSGDDDDAAVPDPVDDGDGLPAVRFCDAFLAYLGDPTPINLDVVVDSAEDPQIDDLADIVASDDQTGRVLAASSDLESLARDRCQAEWVGGAQGAGNTGAAAQAFFDALVAGDRFGARNVASANAIARFEPWSPIEADAELGSPSLLEVGDGSFAMVLDADTLAECQVETGVILACTVAD